MPVTINGTTGFSFPEGSSGTPSIKGQDADTGIFFPENDTIAFAEGGSEALRINSSGNVGIGTTNPTEKLDVIGTGSISSNLYVGRGSGYTQLLRYLGDTNRIDSYNYPITTTVPFSINASETRFQIADVERVRISSSGNVGIGTTNPQEYLDVRGNINVDNDTVRTSLVVKKFNSVHNSANRSAQVGYGMNDGVFTGVLVKNLQGSNPSYNSQSVSIITHDGGNAIYETLTANYNGYVGIGTTNPGEKLTVYSTTTRSGNFISAPASSPVDYDVSEFFKFSRTSAISGITFSASDARLLTALVTPSNEIAWRAYDLGLIATDYLFFSPGSGEKVRITSSGNVGIGITNPPTKLTIAGETAQFPQSLQVFSTGHATSKRASLSLGGVVSNTTPDWILLTDTNGNGTKDLAFYSSALNANPFSIDTAGIVKTPKGFNPGNSYYPMYETTVEFNESPSVWKRIVNATLGGGLYSTVGFKITIIDPQANHAYSATPDQVNNETYYVACVRTESLTLDNPDACYVRGPGDLIRATKTSTGTYQIQIKNPTQYREFQVKIQTYASNQSHTITYHDGDTASAGTAQYNATVSSTQSDIFQNVLIGTNTATGTASQRLQVTGGAYISGNVGIGITNPTAGLTIATAGSTTTGASQIYLHGGTSNRIDFNTNGVAAPAFTTRSAGTKIVLFPEVTPSATDYAIGIENGTLWNSVPLNTSARVFKWYGGTTNIMTLRGDGILTTPYQPAFTAWNVGGATTTGNIVLNTVILNNGNNYSTTTGNFTAPITGIYYFSFTGFTESDSTGSANIEIRKNGSTVVRTFTSEAVNTYRPFATEVIVQLSANDTVRPYAGLNLHGSQNCVFTGHLIG